MSMGTYAKRSAGIAAVVAGLLGAGVAFAAWTSNGTGTGTATATTATPLVISQTASASGLYPTGQVSAPFTVKNPNPYSVTLATAKAERLHRRRGALGLRGLGGQRRGPDALGRSHRRLDLRGEEHGHQDGQHGRRRLPGRDVHLHHHGHRRQQLTAALRRVSVED